MEEWQHKQWQEQIEKKQRFIKMLFFGLCTINPFKGELYFKTRSNYLKRELRKNLTEYVELVNQYSYYKSIN